MFALFHRLPKPLLFGICAAVGCLLAALAGEILLAFTLPQSQQVDIVFVLDVTGSMRAEINGVKKGIGQFVSELNSRELDSRVSLVAFGDRLIGEEPKILLFDGQTFTTDTNSFSREVDSIEMVDGGDGPESSLDALVLAARQPFRAESTKVILLITDASPKIPDWEIASIEAAMRVLQQQKIDQLHLAVQDSDRSAFVDLQNVAPGKTFSLAETAVQRQNFELVLPEVGKQIAAAIGTTSVSDRQFWRLIIITSLWTSLLGIGVFLALIIAQNRYLHRRVLTLRESVTGTSGSIAAGLAAGAAGQLLYGVVPNSSVLEAIGRVLAWAILGSLLGWGMGRFIPNLTPIRGLTGGGVGGILGAIGFLWAAGSGGDIAGRLLGAAILGFFIGFMLAIIEDLARDSWLVVHWGPREESTMTLGVQPILLGSSEQAHIYLQDFPPIAAKIYLMGGKIEYEDNNSRQKTTLKNGSKLQITGAIWIEIKTAK